MDDTRKGQHGMADDTAKPIRVALVYAAGGKVPAWVSGLTTWLQADPSFELVGKLAGQAIPETSRPSLLAVEKFAFRLFKPELAKDNARKALAALPELTGQTGDGKTCFADIAIVTGACTLPDPMLDALVSEEWAIHICGAPAHESELSIMQAISSGGPMVPMTLVSRRPGDSAERALFTAHYNIKPCAVLTSEALEDQALIFLKRALTCHRHKRSIDSGATAPLCPTAVPARARRSYAGRLLRTLTHRLIKRLSEKLNRRTDAWALLQGDATGPEFDIMQLLPVPQTHPLMADPFFLEHEGAVYVFYEAKSKQDEPAWIEVGRLEGEQFIPLGEALRCPYHLSFPFVFSDNGEVFMIPETHETDRLEIWRATRFPFEWELHATALDGLSPADSFLFCKDKTWWLFTNLSKTERMPEHSSALYLFKVDGPALRKVTPHRLNPIVVGSDVARNAGSILKWRGALYRPSQLNARGTYGYGLNIMRIDHLDGENYHETLVKQITPKDLAGASAVHHINWSTGKVIIDVHPETPGASH